MKFHMQDNRVTAQEIVGALLDRYMMRDPETSIPDLAETIKQYRAHQASQLLER